MYHYTTLIIICLFLKLVKSCSIIIYNYRIMNRFNFFFTVLLNLLLCHLLDLHNQKSHKVFMTQISITSMSLGQPLWIALVSIYSASVLLMWPCKLQ